MLIKKQIKRSLRSFWQKLCKLMKPAGDQTQFVRSLNCGSHYIAHQELQLARN